MEYIVLKDKKVVFKGSNNDCWAFILGDQGMSVDYATKYGGYEILENKPVEGEQYALTGASGEKCVANGSSWYESKIEGGE